MTFKVSNREKLDAKSEFFCEEYSEGYFFIGVKVFLSHANGDDYNSYLRTADLTSKQLKLFIKEIKEALNLDREFKQVNSKQWLAAEVDIINQSMCIFFHSNAEHATETFINLTAKETKEFLKKFG